MKKKIIKIYKLKLNQKFEIRNTKFEIRNLNLKCEM